MPCSCAMVHITTGFTEEPRCACSSARFFVFGRVMRAVPVRYAHGNTRNFWSREPGLNRRPRPSRIPLLHICERARLYLWPHGPPLSVVRALGATVLSSVDVNRYSGFTKKLLSKWARFENYHGRALLLDMVPYFSAGT